MHQTKRFGYLGYLSPCALMYMTTGELINLITSNNYWKHFSPYFPGSKDIIKNKLEEISSIRNALAHFRPIKKDDLDLIKQNARHVLSLIEKLLVDIMRCSNIVPTNTQDEWYKELRTLGNEHCTFSFLQSDDEKWLRISFNYNCPILDKSGSDYFCRYRVLNLNTPAVLHEFPKLRAPLIFLYEKIGYPKMKGSSPNFIKSISFVFNHSILMTDYHVIKEQLENILLKISEETGLLQDDHLARGKVIQAVDASTRRKDRENKDHYYEIRYDNLYCIVSDDDPPEYWGQMSYANDDFITSTHKYPWMSVQVSEEELPF